MHIIDTFRDTWISTWRYWCDLSLDSDMVYLRFVFSAVSLSISLKFRFRSALWSDVSMYLLWNGRTRHTHIWYHCAESTDNSIYCNCWWQFIVLPGPDGRHAAYKTVWASERCHTLRPYKMWHATANLNTWIIFTQYYVLSQLN